MQIIILGMHRSGTSLAGQLLQSLGFQFGPEDLALTPKQDNPLGYWERKDVTKLNDEAFAALGVTWERVGEWDITKLPKEFIAKFDKDAEQIIAAFPSGKPWFIKDPRMCLTLPLWEKHLADPIYVFAYRDPIEICRSLWTRNQHPPKLVMALWERYLGSALNATRGKRRLLLRYDDLLRDHKATVRRFVAGLESLGVTLSTSADEAIQKLEVDLSLCHHQRDLFLREILFSPTQDQLNRRISEGTALEDEAPVDLSSANEEIVNAQHTVEFGEACRNWDEPAAPLSLGTTEYDACSFLKLASSRFFERRREVMASLESIHLLGRHLKRSYPELAIGYDYSVVPLVNLCESLLPWNPFNVKRRKAARALRDYLSSPPKCLWQLIERSKSKTGKLWSAKFSKAAESAANLLGEFVLGKIVLAPEELKSGREPVLSHQAQLRLYEEALKETREKVGETAKAIEALTEVLGKTCHASCQSGANHLSPWRCWSPAQRDADVAFLLRLAASLNRWNLFSPLRGDASKVLSKFKATAPVNRLYDHERFHAFAPAIKEANGRLLALLQDLQSIQKVAQTVAASNNAVIP